MLKLIHLISRTTALLRCQKNSEFLFALQKNQFYSRSSARRVSPTKTDADSALTNRWMRGNTRILHTKVIDMMVLTIMRFVNAFQILKSVESANKRSTYHIHEYTVNFSNFISFGNSFTQYQPFEFLYLRTFFRNNTIPAAIHVHTFSLLPYACNNSVPITS